jgi:WD repeat-containing protein 26
LLTAADGRIYVWHKENQQLIETLQGHGKGQSGKACVNTVDWNPVDSGMFASGGDDRKIRM